MNVTSVKVLFPPHSAHLLLYFFNCFRHCYQFFRKTNIDVLRYAVGCVSSHSFTPSFTAVQGIIFVTILLPLLIYTVLIIIIIKN